MKRFFIAIILFLLSEQVAHSQQIVLSLVSNAFTAPVDIKNAGDKRIFVVERSGTIRLIDSSGILQPLPFLNITSRVKSGSEQGLLGLAFDPNFKNNGFFYVDYTRQTDGATRISRFHLTGDPDHCDSTTEQILLTIYQPFTNHNGGDINFGPDGYLYIGMGDGGSGGDPGNRAQNLDSLLGKILRIDVSDSSVSYKIPPGNPFVGKAGRDEIWDYGLRNPWRFSFDRLTHELWIADVGQLKYEEINLEPADSGGVNYGWRCYEGDSAYSLGGCSTITDYTFPVYAYGHTNGNCSVTGGYRYRGTQFPGLYGKYFYADYCVASIRYLTETSPGIFQSFTTNASLANITAFGEDMNGELYVASLSAHAVYRICDASCLTGLEGERILEDITIYPNPGHSTFTLAFKCFSKQKINITLTNMVGQTVFELAKNVNSGSVTIPLETGENPIGIYFMSLQTDKGVLTKKIIVQ